jgi:murein tripeptide amidase MpaA
MTYPSSSDAIEASIQGLATATAFRSICKAFPLPNKTNSVDPSTSTATAPRTYSYLKIGKGSGASRPAMLAIAGIHAREWAQSDAVITFAGNLLSAYTQGIPFTIQAFKDAAGAMQGPVTVPSAQVKVIIEQMDIYLLPLANPDGRAFSMKAIANNGWRKNCSPLPAPYAPNVGADLNRNFDIAWDFDVYFSAAAAVESNFAAHTSKDASRDVFIGPAAFSEAETKNVKWLLDSFPITLYLDLHSFGEKVMYPWGIETDQKTDPAQNFHNAATWDHKRDGVLGTAYQEFFPNAAPLKSFDQHVAMATAMKDCIKSATGADYKVQPSLSLYPCTGGSDDYAFSRQFLTATAPAMFAFSLEFGDSAAGFRPSTVQYPKIEREIHAALIAFARSAAIWRGLIPTVATPTPPASGGGGGSLCSMVAVFIDDPQSPTLAFLRRWRDFLKQQPSTRAVMRVVEAIYYRVSPPVAMFLIKRPAARRLARVGLVEPLVAVLRRLFPEVSSNGH